MHIKTSYFLGGEKRHQQKLPKVTFKGTRQYHCIRIGLHWTGVRTLRITITMDYMGRMKHGVPEVQLLLPFSDFPNWHLVCSVQQRKYFLSEVHRNEIIISQLCFSWNWKELKLMLHSWFAIYNLQIELITQTKVIKSKTQEQTHLRNNILHRWLVYLVHLPTLTHYLLQWPLSFLQGLQKTLQKGLSAPQGIQNAHYQRWWQQSVVWSAGEEPALCPIKRRVSLYTLPRKYLKQFNKLNSPFPSSEKGK